MQKLEGYGHFSRQVLGRWVKKHDAALRAAKGDDADAGDAAAPAEGDFLGKSERRGRTVNVEFEDDVIARLVVTTVGSAVKQARTSDDVRTGEISRADKFKTILASAFYSYEHARVAAKATQNCPKWKDDASVAKLKFSDHWVKLFIERVNFSRQVITSVRTGGWGRGGAGRSGAGRACVLARDRA